MSLLRAFRAGALPEAGGEVLLEAGEAAHLVRVRRARAGERVQVLDGRGGVATGVVEAMNGKTVRIRVEEVAQTPAPRRLELAVGLPKGGVFEEIIHQAAELGATLVVPLLTDRTEVRAGDEARLARKRERWRTVAIEAAKQSGNAWLPETRAPIGFDEWLEEMRARPAKLVRLAAALTPEAKPLEALAQGRNFENGAVVAVGPEGDFTPEEYAQLRAAGFAEWRLPGHVLRVETACAVAAGLLAQVQ